jgi:hypothetical protein
MCQYKWHLKACLATSSSTSAQNLRQDNSYAQQAETGACLLLRCPVTRNTIQNLQNLSSVLYQRPCNSSHNSITLAATHRCAALTEADAAAACMLLWLPKGTDNQTAR